MKLLRVVNERFETVGIHPDSIVWVQRLTDGRLVDIKLNTGEVIRVVHDGDIFDAVEACWAFPTIEVSGLAPLVEQTADDAPPASRRKR